MPDHAPCLRYELRDNVAVITLNRPESRNAMNTALCDALRDATLRFEADPAARAAVLTGAGDAAFCAGMDLKAFAAGEAARINDGPGGFGGFTRAARTKPGVAALNGHALGGGGELALACDLIVMAEHARFGQPEVKVGLYAAAGGVFRLVRALGRAQALEMLLTGDAVTARRALDMGLVNAVVPADQLLGAALHLARRIADNAPLAVRATLALAHAAFDHSEAALWEMNERLWNEVKSSKDAQEGPRAFIEKRAPAWEGK